MNEQLPPLPHLPASQPYVWVWIGGEKRFESANSIYFTADQMRDYARAALAANEKVPSRATDIATALALPGCERLREWAEIGPVQRAAVEEFAYALAAKVPADLGTRLVDLFYCAEKLRDIAEIDSAAEDYADRLVDGLKRLIAATPAPAPEVAQAQQSSEPLPCPFCGHVGLDFADGSTHRWGLASCAGCGATCGETRRAYPPDDKWHASAIKDWNTRAKPEAQQPLGEAQLEAAYREIWRNKPAHFGFTTSDWITAGIRYAERAHGIGASGEASK